RCDYVGSDTKVCTGKAVGRLIEVPDTFARTIDRDVSFTVAVKVRTCRTRSRAFDRFESDVAELAERRSKRPNDGCGTRGLIDRCKLALVACIDRQHRVIERTLTVEAGTLTVVGVPTERSKLRCRQRGSVDRVPRIGFDAVCED